MGLFSFLKSAGSKLTQGEAVPEAVNIKSALNNYKLDTDKVEISINGDKAILSGEIKDQETFEKAVMAVGNTLGISTVNTDNLKITDAKSTNTPQTRFYEVKKGDTLWKIAENIYGSSHGDKNKIIFEANRPMLSSPDKIYPGQSLRIPSLADS